MNRKDAEVAENGIYRFRAGKEYADYRKLQIFSDLHIEFAPFEPPQTDADVIILAGDIHVGKKGIDWARSQFTNTPVIYVLGNHEYYGKAYPKHVNDLKQAIAGTNIHLLETDRVTIDEVTFLGCTLWTDFNLFGNPRMAGGLATGMMSDYRKIRVSPQYRKLRSLDTAIVHRQSLAWLQAEVAELQERDEKYAIVTHHAPSAKSLAIAAREDILSAAYASDLDRFVANSGASLWIHGHIHTQQDYRLGNTRVICNPRGYPDEPNDRFIPNLTIEI